MDALKKARDNNLESKKKVEAMMNKQEQIIAEKYEKLKNKQIEIDNIKEMFEIQRGKQIEIWKEIMEMKSKDFDIDKLCDPDEFGSSIKVWEERYDVSILYLIN